MPDSPLLSHIFLKLAGADAPADLMGDLLEITVESSLHLPDVATVVLHDPGLKWIDDTRLDPGTALVVEAQANGPTGKIFDGEIVELEPEFSPGTQRLRIRAFDRLHRLAHGARVRTFLNSTDSDVVQKVAGEVGLTVQAEPTSEVHPFILQNNQTNLEFLRGRAGALGYLLYVRDQTLHFEPPGAGGQALSLEWGKDMFEFHPRLTTMGQISGVTVRSWDPDTKKAIVGQAQNGRTAPKVGQSEDGGALVQSAFHIQAQAMVTDQPVRSQTAADQQAQAIADRRAGRFIEADATVAGNPAIVAGASLKLEKVSKRFEGTYVVTGATHVYSAPAGYSTQFTVASSEPATLLSVLSAEPQQSRMPGLVIGIVTDNTDPDGLGRVKVKYPSLSDTDASDWARVLILGGGKERGFEVLPEVNDEVLVGFEAGDPHFPYVLGGLWNGVDAPPEKSTSIVSGGKVQKRIIKSRTGHTITIDDSDGGGGITIEDSTKNNKFVLDSQNNAFTIEVKGDGTIKTDGKLSLEAKGAVEIKGLGATVDAGSGKLQVKGMGASMDGGGSTVEVKGISATLDGGPNVTVKGAQISLGM